MYLGIDIGGTKTLVACLDDHGVIVEQVKFPTPEKYPDFVDKLTDVVEGLTTQEFIGGCVATPGRIDRERGIGIAFGNLSWKNVPLETDVRHIARCPIILENDAKLAGLSESMLLKEYEKVLYVTISTGIGTGFIVDQTIAPDLVDSEGGHMMIEYHGKLQEWEDFASGRAIVDRFGKKAKDIHDVETWKLISHDIALGVINLIAVVQPDVIVFGGSVGVYFDRFQPHLEKELEKYETPLTPIPPLRKAARPDEAVVYGCYDLAKSEHEGRN